MIGRFNELVSVYHCIDEYTVGTKFRKKATIEALEAQMLTKADIVFANSLITWENKKKTAPHANHFPSGANIEFFKQAQTAKPHPETGKLRRPILMYVGSINEKINLRLLLNVARSSKVSLILVGQTYPGVFHEELDQLKGLKNVYFAGKRPFSEMPSWLAAADICLLPYVKGEATRYQSPLKLYEYLATGKPILSTPHPEVEELAHCVTVAIPNNWNRAITMILDNDGAEHQDIRWAEAQNHSWEHRVDGMLNVINGFMEGKNG